MRHPSEDKIRIVLEGLRGESSTAGAAGRVSAKSPDYAYSKEFLEAGKKRLAGDTVRAATVAKLRICGVRLRSSRRFG